MYEFVVRNARNMPPVAYRTAYRSEQRDSRTPLWYKNLYLGLCFSVALLTIIVASGAIFEAEKCSLSLSSSYLTGNRMVGYVALAFGTLLAAWSLYMIVQWSWVWMKDVPFAAPLPRYGEDVEDIEPGFLTVSSARSFLSTQAATDATKREVERALGDLEKA